MGVAMVTPTTMVEGHWLAVSPRDPRLIGLYRQHYSFRGKRMDRVLRGGIAGFGDALMLLTVRCDAAFVWVRPPGGVQQSGQRGVNCLLFRNTSATRSSELIREAMDLAWRRWPGERLFTYVNPAKIRSTNPGACFKYAGWRRCGMSKGGLVILECVPEEVAT